MADSSKRRSAAKDSPPKKPAKPRADFPLFPHANGGWAKKVRGKLFYFGGWKNDPKGVQALDLWLDQKDDLYAGRTPRLTSDGATVQSLVNHFLTAKKHALDCGELSVVSFADYHRTCGRMVAAFGRHRAVEDLTPTDFAQFRAKLAEGWSPVTLGNEVTRVRVICNYGYDEELIDRPIKYGKKSFRKPPKRVIRQARLANGPRMFLPGEIRTLLDAAQQPLRSMILLAINAGLGNGDVGLLPFGALDMVAGILDFPRPKTSIERRAFLWPETLDAIRQWTAIRPTPADEALADRVFLTVRGASWHKEISDNPVAKEFAKLTRRLGLLKKGRGFYALRHSFVTAADGARDPVAARFIMGHAPPPSDMGDVYREHVSDDRLHAISDHVHTWLFHGRGDSHA